MNKNNIIDQYENNTFIWKLYLYDKKYYITIKKERYFCLMCGCENCSGIYCIGNLYIEYFYIYKKKYISENYFTTKLIYNFIKNMYSAIESPDIYKKKLCKKDNYIDLINIKTFFFKKLNKDILFFIAVFI
jgi:hypothetical protein